MRDYDPTTGRYIQADPLGLVDGASVYGYARQNPGRYVDPRGENTVALAPILCTGPQAAVCAGILVCGGIAAAIIYNSTGEEPDECENCGEDGPIGNNPEERPGRTNTDLPGGEKGAEELFEEYAEPPYTNEGDHLVGSNGVRLRPGKDGRPRVDIPAGEGKLSGHETIHFD